MVLSYLFAWYNIWTYEQIVTGTGNDYLSVHPVQTSWFDPNPNYRERRAPTIDGQPAFSNHEPMWFAQQLEWMRWASIDATAVVFQPSPDFYVRSTTAATNLNTALNSMPESPAVCLFLETAPYLRGVDLRSEQGIRKLLHGILEFYGRIDQRHWLTINNEVPVILYKGNVDGLTISDRGMNEVRRRFQQWSGRRLCFFGNDTWRGRAPTAVQYSCNWGAGNRVNRIQPESDLMQVSPGMNYRGTTGNAPRSADGYRIAFEAARRTEKNWLAIETWSEFIEVSAICPTKEDGSIFLQITQSQARRFKNRQ